MLYFLSAAVLSLAVGALGEIMDYRLCLSLCGVSSFAVCMLTVWKSRADVKKLYNA